MLHVGNARTALITWLFARKHGGHFLLRIDDTDRERSKTEYETAIEDSLVWMGLGWDEKINQQHRLERYAERIEQLKADGRLYACYETPDELALKRKTQLSRGKPPIYDRAALELTDPQKAAYEAEGRAPHWRFKLEHTPIEWEDLIRGPVKFNGADLSDPVVIREDGSPLYHLCSVIDDADFRITHVVRGEEHVSNTAAHVQMFEALGATPPEFVHLPLISDSALDFDRPVPPDTPGIDRAEGYRCELDPGEMLVLPSRYWHFIEYIEPSAAVSYSFYTGRVTWLLGTLNGLFYNGFAVVRQIHEKRWFRRWGRWHARTRARLRYGPPRGPVVAALRAAGLGLTWLAERTVYCLLWYPMLFFFLARYRGGATIYASKT